MKPFQNIYEEFTALLTVFLTVGLFLIGIPLIFLPLKPLKNPQKRVIKGANDEQVVIPGSSQFFVISKKANSPSKFQLQAFSASQFRSF